MAKTLDPTLVVAALSAAETLVNDVVYHDPVAHQSLADLNGKWLKAHVQDMNASIYVGVEQQRIQLQSALGFDADTEISATVGDIQKLMLAQDKQAEVASLDINVKGSTQLLIGYAKLFEKLDVDWEGFFAAKLGNTLGSLVGSSLRKAVRFAKDVKSKAENDTKIWLHHESDMLPYQSEVESFKQRLKEMRYGLDRLEAKVRRLDLTIKDGQ